MTQTLDDLLARATFKVEGTESQGTAFFVGPGLALTCAHLFKLNVPLKANVEMEGIKVTVDPFPADGDCALLRLSTTDHPVLPLDYLPSRVGDPLLAWGYPPTTVASGIPVTPKIEGRLRTAPGKERIGYKIADARIELGHSGSPVVNLETGGVAGMIIMTRSQTSSEGGYIISAEQLLSLIPEIHGHRPHPLSDAGEWFHVVRQPRPALHIARQVSDGLQCHVRLPPMTEPCKTNATDYAATLIELDVIDPSGSRIPIAEAVMSSWAARKAACFVGDPGAGKSSAYYTLVRRLGPLPGGAPHIQPLLLHIDDPRTLPTAALTYAQFLPGSVKPRGLLSSATDAPLDRLFAESSPVRPCLFIDGLEQLAETDGRALIASLLSSADRAPMQLVFTGRPSIIARMFVGVEERVNRYPLAPLTTDQAACLLLQRGCDRNSLDRMTHSTDMSPLLLACLAMMDKSASATTGAHQPDEHPPRRVGGSEVVWSYINWVQSSWNLPPGVKPEHVRQFLSLLAIDTVEAQTASEADAEQLHRLTARTKWGQSGFQARSDWAALREFFAASCGLVTIDSNGVHWLHSQVRDLLAAEHLFDDTVVAGDAHAHPTGLTVNFLARPWHEVGLFFLDRLAEDTSADNAAAYVSQVYNLRDRDSLPLVAGFLRRRSPLSGGGDDLTQLAQRLLEALLPDIGSAALAVTSASRLRQKLCEEVITGRPPRLSLLVPLLRDSYVYDKVSELLGSSTAADLCRAENEARHG